MTKKPFPKAKRSNTQLLELFHYDIYKLKGHLTKVVNNIL